MLERQVPDRAEGGSNRLGLSAPQTDPCPEDNPNVSSLRKQGPTWKPALVARRVPALRPGWHLSESQATAI